MVWDLSIWMGRLERPTGDRCCMGAVFFEAWVPHCGTQAVGTGCGGRPNGDSCCMWVALQNECPYGWTDWKDQLEIVVAWGLACTRNAHMDVHAGGTDQR